MLCREVPLSLSVTLLFQVDYVVIEELILLQSISHLLDLTLLPFLRQCDILNLKKVHIETWVVACSLLSLRDNIHWKLIKIHGLVIYLLLQVVS